MSNIHIIAFLIRRCGLEIPDFLMNFSIISAPKSFYDPLPDEHIKVFTNQDINKILGVNSTYFFNRGDFNFFSQYGNAAYSFWTHSFYLTSADIVQASDNHDVAVDLLFAKAMEYFKKNNITNEKIARVLESFDCKCQLMLSVPISNRGIIFDIKSDKLKFIAEYDIEFGYRVLEKKLIDELKGAAQI